MRMRFHIETRVQSAARTCRTWPGMIFFAAGAGLSVWALALPAECQTVRGKTSGPAYTVTRLPFGSAHGINDYGQVVGTSPVLNGASLENRFGLWTPNVPNGMTGVLVDLGTLDGNDTQAAAIGPGGQVLGSSVPAGGSYGAASPMFLWTPSEPYGVTGTMVDLGTPLPYYGYPVGVNGSGTVLANFYGGFWLRDSTGGWRNGAYIDGTASGINSGGQVAGSFMVNAYASHAFLWDSATGLRDMGTMGRYDYYSQANGINDLGQVVGASTEHIEPRNCNSDFGCGYDVTHGFLWTKGAFKDLGTLGGDNCVATSVNNAGVVVGYSSTATDIHPFIFQAGKMKDLNSPIDPSLGIVLDGRFTLPRINNYGQIIVHGYDAASVGDYLLTPIPR
jgi:probable HAF family extracellular repeat protein